MARSSCRNSKRRTGSPRRRPTKRDATIAMSGAKEGGRFINRKPCSMASPRATLSLSDNPRWPGGILNITAGSNRSVMTWAAGDRYLMLVFRPFDANFGGMRRCRNAGSRQVPRPQAKGDKSATSACVVIETDSNPGMQLSYWLDPARDYIPLRQHRIAQRRRSRTAGYFLQGRSDVRVGSNRLDGFDRRNGRSDLQPDNRHRHRFHDQSTDPSVRSSRSSIPRRESPRLADRPARGTPESRASGLGAGETEADRRGEGSEGKSTPETEAQTGL